MFEQALKTLEYALDCLKEARVKAAEALALSKASQKMARDVYDKRISNYPPICNRRNNND